MCCTSDCVNVCLSVFCSVINFFWDAGIVHFLPDLPLVHLLPQLRICLKEVITWTTVSIKISSCTKHVAFHCSRLSNPVLFVLLIGRDTQLQRFAWNTTGVFSAIISVFADIFMALHYINTLHPAVPSPSPGCPHVEGGCMGWEYHTKTDPGQNRSLKNMYCL